MKTFSSIYSEFNYIQSRARRNFLTATLSIGLVLFILGLFGMFTLFGSDFVTYTKSTIQMKAFLNDGITGSQVEKIIQQIRADGYANEIQYVSKEEAGKILLQKTGEDVKKMMGGTNPLLASLNILLKPAYISVDSVNLIKKELLAIPSVVEVDYPVTMMIAIERNVRNFRFIGSVVLILTVLICFYLIINTIKLSIFSKRLNIRTMQLIGATPAFIRKPFLQSGMIQGFIAGVFASILLAGLLSVVNIRLASMEMAVNLFSRWEFFALLIGIVLFGVLLGFCGSYIAVNRFLNKSLDQLLAE